MTLRDIRGEVIAAFESELRRYSCPHPAVVAMALAAIAEGHGVKLSRPALADDPVADHTRPVAPGDTRTGAASVRVQIHRPTESNPAPTHHLASPPWHKEADPTDAPATGHRGAQEGQERDSGATEHLESNASANSPDSTPPRACPKPGLTPTWLCLDWRHTQCTGTLPTGAACTCECHLR